MVLALVMVLTTTLSPFSRNNGFIRSKFSLNEVMNRTLMKNKVNCD